MAKTKYAADEIGEVKVVRGHWHDYLAMVLDYSVPGVLKVDMTKYLKSMIEDFPTKLEGKGVWIESIASAAHPPLQDFDSKH